MNPESSPLTVPTATTNDGAPPNPLANLLANLQRQRRRKNTPGAFGGAGNAQIGKRGWKRRPQSS